MRRLLILFGCLYFFAVGCHKRVNVCEEDRGLETSSLNISILNTAANSYMYTSDESQATFKRDSFQVFNEDGRRFTNVKFYLTDEPGNHLKKYYVVRIAPAFIIPDDDEAFTKEKSRKIYLKYSYKTSDTLTLVFKALKDGCGKGQYEYLRISHKGNQIASVTGGFTATFTLAHF